jgi:hypothetical protein
MRKQNQQDGLRTDPFAPVRRASEGAFQLANNIFEYEKSAHLGHVPRLATPPTIYFSVDSGQMYALTGRVFHEHAMPERDQQDLVIRLLARCMDASAIVRVAAAWEVLRCAACGCGQFTYEVSGKLYGAKALRVSKDPDRRWLLCCDLRLRMSDDTWSWRSRAKFDPGNRICGWDDSVWGKSWGVTDGRYHGPWALKKWMEPHFQLNCPLVQTILAGRPEAESEAVARWIEARTSTGPSLLRVDPVQLKKTLKAVNVRAFHGRTPVYHALGGIR